MDAEAEKLRSTGAAYGDGERVPLTTYRCKSKSPEDVGHWCRRMIDHPNMHRCVCGKVWPHEH